MRLTRTALSRRLLLLEQAMQEVAEAKQLTPRAARQARQRVWEFINGHINTQLDRVRES